MKHILIWTDIQDLESNGQSYFIKRKCNYFNCYLTKNKSLFGDLRYFDLILFNLQDVSQDTQVLPYIRSNNQKYVFVANSSAHNYPVCDSIYDNFFNWTWTYKYDSTIPYKFITVHNLQYEELGSHFHWNTNMKPIDAKLKSQLQTKSKAAVIFLDECHSRSKREILVKELQKELSRFNLTVDVFGACSVKQCRRKTMHGCFWRVKKTYYFYLALEDSLSPDYITDIVLYAYNNNAVPIVYGGANYVRYLPPGSYIDTYKKTSSQIAEAMYNVIRNRELYYDFFRWKNHYIISKSSGLDGCALCELMNNPARLIQQYSYSSFRKWWNPKYQAHCAVSNKLVL
ncbi:unnamed protein product [Colias eurytheme]|nr:unnamed protein product [Colias eurytheme]